MRLTRLRDIQGSIELRSGLHIGSGNTEMHIGGTDNPVIKNPVSGEPYIPGSSLKGKVRSLMEWRAGVVECSQGKPLRFRDLAVLNGEQLTAGENILRLFGGAPEGADQDQNLVARIGPTRLAFWDAGLSPEWVKGTKDQGMLLTEVKMENSIDRIKGVAENPRNTERVPAGARFDFRLTMRVHDGEDLLEDVLLGLRLLELTGLGGSGSRGYGKLSFEELTCDGEDVSAQMRAVTV